MVFPMKLFNFNSDEATVLERYRSAVHVLVIFCILLFVALAIRLFDMRIEKTNLKYEDLVSIILTALGVMLACVSLMLGALAVIGWSTFQEGVKRRVTDEITIRFGKDGDLRPFLSDELAKIALEQEKTSKDPNSYLGEADETKDVDG
jgi:hypothetical protein